jgi:hypothetical protein
VAGRAGLRGLQVAAVRQRDPQGPGASRGRDVISPWRLCCITLPLGSRSPDRLKGLTDRVRVQLDKKCSIYLIMYQISSFNATQDYSRERN